MTSFIPFPSKHRRGHAQKIAVQLARARSNREADHFLIRALDIHERHLREAFAPEATIKSERIDFIVLIHEECRKMRSHWYPAIPADQSPGGAA